MTPKEVYIPVPCSERLPEMKNINGDVRSDTIIAITEKGMIETFHDYSDFNDNGLSWFVGGYEVVSWLEKKELFVLTKEELENLVSSVTQSQINNCLDSLRPTFHDSMAYGDVASAKQVDFNDWINTQK